MTALRALLLLLAASASSGQEDSTARLVDPFLLRRESAFDRLLESRDEGRARALVALRSGDHRSRRLALRAIGELGVARDVPLLHDHLDDEDAATRIEAAEALARLAARGEVALPVAFPPEVAALPAVALGVARFTEDTVIGLCRRSRTVAWYHGREYLPIVRLGSLAAPSLRRLAGDRRYLATDARCHAIIALGRLGDRDQVPFLLDTIASLEGLFRNEGEDVPQIRAALVAALTLIGDPRERVLEAYLEAVDDGDAFVRVYGAWGLFDAVTRVDESTRERIADKLAECVYFDHDPAALSTLALALQHAGEPSHADRILERLREHWRLVDYYLLDAFLTLSEGSDVANEELGRQLESENPAARALARHGLGRPADEALETSLVKMVRRNPMEVEDPSELAPCSALLALGLLEVTGALDEVIRASRSDSDQIRTSAVVALGNLGGPAARDALVPRLEDRSEYVRFFAARSLEQLGDPRAVPGYIDALRSGNAFLMRSAIGSLARIVGTDLGFRANLPPAERLAAVRRWESWWEANRAAVRSDGASLRLDTE